MSDTIKARYVGHPDGTYLPLVPVGTDGETRSLTVPYGGELPTEIDGQRVPARFRDSLLQQKDNWTRVKRGDTDEQDVEPDEPDEPDELEVSESDDTTAAKADEKEA